MRILVQKILPILAIIFILLALVFLLGKIGQHRQIVDAKAARDADKPIPVSTFVVDKAPIRPLLVGNCTTENSRLVEVIAPLRDLYITASNAEPGQVVQEGDELLVLDQRAAIARVELAKDRLAGLEKEVAERQKVVDYFWENRKSGQSLEIDYRRELIDLVRTQGDLATADDDLELAKIELTNTVLKAPVSGVVQSIVSAGEVSRQDVMLASISVVDPIVAKCEFDVTDYGYLRSVRNDGVVYFRGLEGQGFLANYLMEDTASSATDNLIWRFNIDNSERMLQSNMRGYIRFTSEYAVVRVPSVSVLNRNGELAQVFVVNKNNVAKLTQVTVGQQAGGFTEIGVGLEVGQEVVVAGQLNLIANDKVSVVDQRKVTFPYDS